MKMSDEMSVPVVDVPAAEDKCTCGTKTCGAVKHINEMQENLDERMRELRVAERQYNEAVRKLMLKSIGLIVILAGLLPTAWASFLGLI